MKTLIKSLLVAFSLTLISLSASLAETNPGTTAATYKYGIYTTAEGKLSIALDKQTNGTVVVRLVNSKGDVFFVERVGKHQKATRLRLDLSALPDGAYQIEITNGVDTTTHALTLATQQPSVSSRLVAIN